MDELLRCESCGNMLSPRYALALCRDCQKEKEYQKLRQELSEYQTTLALSEQSYENLSEAMILANEKRNCELAAANARVAELEAKAEYFENEATRKNIIYQSAFNRAEQAEAQCAKTDKRNEELWAEKRDISNNYVVQKDRADNLYAENRRLREALSEILAVFRDEDVIVTEEMKERWLKVLGDD